MAKNGNAIRINRSWCLMASLPLLLGTAILILSFLSQSSFNEYYELAIGVGLGLQIIGVAMLLFSKTKVQS